CARDPFNWADWDEAYYFDYW
nr:immunoglobulin heavy chain junction region [Macaca mulatta]